MLPAESPYEYEIEWEDGDPSDRRKRASQIKTIVEKDETCLSAREASIDRFAFSFSKSFLHGSYLVNVPEHFAFENCRQK